ncbi:hypothetical protein [Microbacterium sp. H83]|uniref:hypothetical protein n=1 Tax=Microbacterium sp. H83 TaxID=1827324 RepID=UPI0012F91A9B|nr:hypothetical protein [Microbacterium sp. H83]
MDTLDEWLADDLGEPLVRAEFGVLDGGPLPGPIADPSVLKLVGTTTMVNFAHFGMGIDEVALEGSTRLRRCATQAAATRTDPSTPRSIARAGTALGPV